MMFISHKNSIWGLSVCVCDVIKSRAWMYIMLQAQSGPFLSGSTHLKEFKSEAKKYFCGINIDGTTVQGLEVFAHWLCFQIGCLHTGCFHIGCLHTGCVFRLAVYTLAVFSDWLFTHWLCFHIGCLHTGCVFRLAAHWPCFQISCSHISYVFRLAVCTLTLFLD